MHTDYPPITFNHNCNHSLIAQLKVCHGLLAVDCVSLSDEVPTLCSKIFVIFYIMINCTMHHDIKGSLVSPVNCTFNLFLLEMKKYNFFPLQVFSVTI